VLPGEVTEIARTLEDAGYETWCVGGALRDHLLGDTNLDVDLATAATPDVVQRLFRRTVAVGVKHGTIGVLGRQRRLHEVTTFRRDVATDGRHAEVAFGVSLHEDLARRDFTINALAYHPLRHQWQDPFGGYDDLRAGIIRAVGTPVDRLREDYLRVLRALRFAARFGFTIEPETWAGMQASVGGLAGLSAERIRDEWFKGLASARSVLGFARLWRESGAAGVVLPELLADPVLAFPAPADRDPVLLTALLVEDPCGVLRRLRASGAEIERLDRFTAAEPAPASPAAGDVRRWMNRCGAAVDDLLAAHHLRTGSPAPWAEAVAGVRARGEAVNRGGLAVTGRDLAEAGIPPGPEMGALLDRLLHLVLEEPALNRREILLAKARAAR
jgi:tRNA nucleotidyltransferase (CCA-adding enzyme)